MCDPTSCQVNCVVRVEPKADARTVTLCACDPDADKLAALITAGHGQREASEMLWPECRRSA